MDDLYSRNEKKDKWWVVYYRTLFGIILLVLIVLSQIGVIQIPIEYSLGFCIVVALFFIVYVFFPRKNPN
jgi:hypothetical protein